MRAHGRAHFGLQSGDVVRKAMWILLCGLWRILRKGHGDTPGAAYGMALDYSLRKPSVGKYVS
jgi:hypothetical protein